MSDRDIEAVREAGMRLDAWPARCARREDDAARIESERASEEGAQQCTAGNTLIAARGALIAGRITPIIRRRERSDKILRAGLREVE
ncbi:MAG TPA: hypothetical protein VHX19_16175 [Stellaceae bacterium]|nr:hypothetical protein [Stellaceae bacterium]